MSPSKNPDRSLQDPSCGPVRILHVITRLDLGGSAENTLVTVLGLDKKRFDVDLVCGLSDNPPSHNEQTAIAAGIRIVRLRSLVRRISPVNDLRALVSLYLLIRRNEYRIVHTHTSKPGIVARLAAKLAGTPVIAHTPHGHIFYGYFSPAVTRFFIALERFATMRTHALITLTHREKEEYLARGIGTPGRMHPIFSGIDLQPYLAAQSDPQRIRAGVGLTPEDFVCITVARLVEVKNHDLIISAAALCAQRLPRIRFVFVGDGDLKQRLEQRVNSLGLSPHFAFLGWRKDIPALMSAANAFVMTSSNEGMGRAFVEAQASGLPVIGTRVAGIPEVMIDGETGFLVPPDDAPALAGRIESLYNDRGLARRMGEAGRAWVNPRFSRDVMVDKIDSLYGRLLDETSKERAPDTL